MSNTGKGKGLSGKQRQLDEVSEALRSGRLDSVPPPQEILALFGLPHESDQLRGIVCQSEKLADADDYDSREELIDAAPKAFAYFPEDRVRKILEGDAIDKSERRLIEAELTGWWLADGYGTSYAVYELLDSRGRPIYIVHGVSGGGPDYSEDFYGPFADAAKVDTLFGKSGWFPPGGTDSDELFEAARKKRIPITRYTGKRKPTSV
jgi:hypothetical protein